MIRMDYTYTFTDIENRFGSVQMIDHQRNIVCQLRVAVDDSRLFPVSDQRVSAQVADLFDLAVAVYSADRLSVRQGENSCYIHLEVPVRHPEVLGEASVIEQLQEVLYWYTLDHWYFTFTKRTTPGRLVEQQMRLIPSDGSRVITEVALWSGGLDSLAGLCNRLVTDPTIQYVLFGTGANAYIGSLQQTVATAVRRRFPAAGHLPLVQVPLRLSDSSGLKRHRDLRTRGFIFMLLGAACAYLQGQNTLHVYENGIGAINLPFRASEVGLDHARSVHPLSLLKMGHLVSLLLNTPFSFCNPFLFKTKAQMCQVFVDTDTTDLIAGTVTCDRRHRRKPMQCGCCSSCLLRRQALATQGIDDDTQYVVPESRPARPGDGLHLRAMLHQVAALRSSLAAPDPWYRVTKRHPSLWDSAEEVASYEGISVKAAIDKLLQLYRRYVEEWDQVGHKVGAALLHSSELQPVTEHGVDCFPKGHNSGYQYP